MFCIYGEEMKLVQRSTHMRSLLWKHHKRFEDVRKISKRIVFLKDGLAKYDVSAR